MYTAVFHRITHFAISTHAYEKYLCISPLVQTTGELKQRENKKKTSMHPHGWRSLPKGEILQCNTDNIAFRIAYSVAYSILHVWTAVMQFIPEVSPTSSTRRPSKAASMTTPNKGFDNSRTCHTKKQRINSFLTSASWQLLCKHNGTRRISQFWTRRWRNTSALQ